MLLSALVAEDHDVTREGLRTLLADKLEARVVATTGDGLDVVPLLKEHEPDLLILDLGLPHLTGLNILRRLDSLSLSTQVVVLSMHAEDSYVREALQLGARAYVLKGSPLAELETGIRAVMKGERYLGSELSEDLLERRPTAKSQVQDRYQMLTEREREVLQLTAEGHTSREIGEKLHISHRTVDKHRENVQKKLELRNTVEMATYAHRNGLLPHPPSLESNAEAGHQGGADA